MFDKFLKLTLMMGIILALPSCSMKVGGNGKNPPIKIDAQLKIDSVGGDTSHPFVLTVETNLSGGSGNLALSQIEYDFDCDGHVDKTSNETSAQFTYPDVGVFKPCVNVVAVDLKQSSSKKGTALSTSKVSSDLGQKKGFELGHNVYVTEPIDHYVIEKVDGILSVDQLVTFKITAYDVKNKPIPNAAIKLSADMGAVSIVEGRAFESFTGFIGNGNYVNQNNGNTQYLAAGGGQVSDSSLKFIVDASGVAKIKKQMPPTLYADRAKGIEIYNAAKSGQLINYLNEIPNLEIKNKDQFNLKGIGEAQKEHPVVNQVLAGTPQIITVDMENIIPKNNANVDVPIKALITDSKGNPVNFEVHAVLDDTRLIKQAVFSGNYMGQTDISVQPSDRGLVDLSFRPVSNKAGIFKISMATDAKKYESTEGVPVQAGEQDTVEKEVKSLMSAGDAIKFMCFNANNEQIACVSQDFSQVVDKSFDKGSIVILPMDSLNDTFVYPEYKDLQVCWKIKCSSAPEECPSFANVSPDATSFMGRRVEYVKEDNGTQLCTYIDIADENNPMDPKLNGKTALPLSTIKMGTRVGKYQIIPTIGKYTAESETKTPSMFSLKATPDKAIAISPVGYKVDFDANKLNQKADLLDGIGKFKLYKGNQSLYNNLLTNSVKVYVVDKFSNIVDNSNYNFEFSRFSLINSDVKSSLAPCENDSCTNTAQMVEKNTLMQLGDASIVGIDATFVQALNQSNIDESKDRLATAIIDKIKDNSGSLIDSAQVDNEAVTANLEGAKEYRVTNVSQQNNLGINVLRFFVGGRIDGKYVAAITRPVAIETPYNYYIKSIVFNNDEDICVNAEDCAKISEYDLSALPVEKDAPVQISFCRDGVVDNATINNNAVEYEAAGLALASNSATLNACDLANYTPIINASYCMCQTVSATYEYFKVGDPVTLEDKLQLLVKDSGNDPNKVTKVIALKGKRLSPARIKVTPSSIALGNVGYYEKTKNLEAEIAKTGDQSLDSLSCTLNNNANNCFVLSSNVPAGNYNGNQTVKISFKYKGYDDDANCIPGAADAVVTCSAVTASAVPIDVAVNLSATRMTKPKIDITPVTFDFGTKLFSEISQFSDKMFTIKNTGGTAEDSLSISLVSSVFDVKANDCPATLNGGESCQVTVGIKALSSWPLDGPFFGKASNGTVNGSVKLKILKDGSLLVNSADIGATIYSGPAEFVFDSGTSISLTIPEAADLNTPTNKNFNIRHVAGAAPGTPVVAVNGVDAASFAYVYNGGVLDANTGKALGAANVAFTGNVYKAENYQAELVLGSCPASGICKISLAGIVPEFKISVSPASPSMNIVYGQSGSITLSIAATTNIKKIEVVDAVAGAAGSSISSGAPSVVGKNATVVINVNHNADVMSYNSTLKIRATANYNNNVVVEQPVSILVKSVCPKGVNDNGLTVDSVACSGGGSNIGTIYVDDAASYPKTCTFTVKRQPGCSGGTYSMNVSGFDSDISVSPTIPQGTLFIGQGLTTSNTLSYYPSANPVKTWGAHSGTYTLWSSSSNKTSQTVSLNLYKDRQLYEIVDAGTITFNSRDAQVTIKHVAGTEPGVLPLAELLISNVGSALFKVAASSDISSSSNIQSDEIFYRPLRFESKKADQDYNASIYINKFCKSNCKVSLFAHPPLPVVSLDSVNNSGNNGYSLNYNGTTSETLIFAQTAGWDPLGSVSEGSADPGIQGFVAGQPYINGAGKSAIQASIGIIHRKDFADSNSATNYYWNSVQPIVSDSMGNFARVTKSICQTCNPSVSPCSNICGAQQANYVFKIIPQYNEVNCYNTTVASCALGTVAKGTTGIPCGTKITRAAGCPSITYELLLNSAPSGFTSSNSAGPYTLSTGSLNMSYVYGAGIPLANTETPVLNFKFDASVNNGTVGTSTAYGMISLRRQGAPAPMKKVMDLSGFSAAPSIAIGTSQNNSYNFGTVEFMEVKRSPSFQVSNLGNCILNIKSTDSSGTGPIKPLNDRIECGNASILPNGISLSVNGTIGCNFKSSMSEYQLVSVGGFSQEVPYYGTITDYVHFSVTANCNSGALTVSDAGITRTGVTGTSALTLTRLSPANIQISSGQLWLRNVMVGVPSGNMTYVPMSTTQVMNSWGYSLNWRTALPAGIIKNTGGSTAVNLNITMASSAGYTAAISSLTTLAMNASNATSDIVVYPTAQISGCYSSPILVSGYKSNACKNLSVPECKFQITGGTVTICRSQP